MSKLGHLIRAAFNTANSSRKSIGRPAYVGLLIATTGAALLCAGGAAHSGPCTVQIAQLESGKSGCKCSCLGESLCSRTIGFASVPDAATQAQFTTA
jgi:hypothetical protein